MDFKADIVSIQKTWGKDYLPKRAHQTENYLRELFRMEAGGEAAE